MVAFAKLADASRIRKNYDTLCLKLDKQFTATKSYQQFQLLYYKLVP